MSYISEPVAKIIRGNLPESIHWGSAAVVNSEGKLIYRVGDPYFVTYLRSSAKPFQIIPLVESGAAKKFNFSTKEIAIMAGSHSGEDFQIETVKGILDKIGLTEDHLQCGTHVPHRFTAQNLTPEPGQAFTPIEHNCSGKHASMLALAIFKELPVESYLSPEHAVQKIIKSAVADICGYPENLIGIGTDGCSAPNMAIPLYNMALGYARLVSPTSVSKDKAKAYSTIAQAMQEYPEMVGGTDRFDTVIMKTPGEPIISKAGAEALSCMSLIDRKTGLAVKITDGAPRALYPTAVELLYKLGVRKKSDDLARFHHPKMFNFRKLEVGYIDPSFNLYEVDHE